MQPRLKKQNKKTTTQQAMCGVVSKHFLPI